LFSIRIRHGGGYFKKKGKIIPGGKKKTRSSSPRTISNVTTISSSFSQNWHHVKKDGHVYTTNYGGKVAAAATYPTQLLDFPTQHFFIFQRILYL
jgi:hypothetical protein